MFTRAAFSIRDERGDGNREFDKEETRGRRGCDVFTVAVSYRLRAFLDDQSCAT